MPMESGLDLEKQNLDSGRGRTFFLTSLLIELIVPRATHNRSPNRRVTLAADRVSAGRNAAQTGGNDVKAEPTEEQIAAEVTRLRADYFRMNGGDDGTRTRGLCRDRESGRCN